MTIKEGGGNSTQKTNTLNIGKIKTIYTSSIAMFDNWFERMIESLFQLSGMNINLSYSQ